MDGRIRVLFVREAGKKGLQMHICPTQCHVLYGSAIAIAGNPCMVGKSKRRIVRMHRRRASLPPEYEPISLAPQIIPSSQSISISNASQQRYQSLQTLLADIGVDKADPDSHHLRGGPHLGCVGDFTRGSDHHAPKPGPSYARTAAADPSDARALVPHAPVSLQWPHSSVMDLLMQQALAPYDPNLASVLKGHRPSWTSNMGLGLSPSALADAITSCLNSGTDGKILALSLPLTRSA